MKLLDRIGQGVTASGSERFLWNVLLLPELSDPPIPSYFFLSYFLYSLGTSLSIEHKEKSLLSSREGQS